MNMTLHLTNRCNLRCSYCYVCKDSPEDMDLNTARKAVDMACSFSKDYVGISFFGGEPLIKKDLIYSIIEYTKFLQKEKGFKFSFNMTTNGLLLDEEFIKYSLNENVFISVSHDGIKEAHDKNRTDNYGKATYDLLLTNIKLLLELSPYSPVMQVVNTDTVEFFKDSVSHLFDLGFKFIISTLNFKDEWTNNMLKVLKRQYEDISELYLKKTLNEDKFYFSPFDVKINSYIDSGKNINKECNIGVNQISIAPNGSIYPCIQFVGDGEYIIGSVKSGINFPKRDELNKKSHSVKKECVECAVKSRCISNCACLLKQTTGSMDRVSPVLCAHEHIIIPVADRLAEKLYNKRSAMFIHKHYNKLYPAVSLIEDLSENRNL